MTRYDSVCGICGAAEGATVYFGRVRDGAFPNVTADSHAIRRCAACGADRLDEAACRDDSLYEDEMYRRLLGEPDTAEGFLATHRELQEQRLAALGPVSFDGKTVADVGCAAGGFLALVCDSAARCIAVEPCRAYHEHLRRRGYTLYERIEDALAEELGSCDYVFCFSVIEHVKDPVGLLRGIRSLLSLGGKAIISTPNREDVLMYLLGDEYKAFFYRSVHRWYFDMSSFERCAGLTGFRVEKKRCSHRFGLSNAMLWLRDKRPPGSGDLAEIEDLRLNNAWRKFLEDNGKGDYLYFRMVVEKEGSS